MTTYIITCVTDSGDNISIDLGSYPTLKEVQAAVIELQLRFPGEEVTVNQ